MHSPRWLPLPQLRPLDRCVATHHVAYAPPYATPLRGTGNETEQNKPASVSVSSQQQDISANGSTATAHDALYVPRYRRTTTEHKGSRYAVPTTRRWTAMRGSDTKLCASCKLDLPIASFRPDARLKCELSSWCINARHSTAEVKGEHKTSDDRRNDAPTSDSSSIVGEQPSRPQT